MASHLIGNSQIGLGEMLGGMLGSGNGIIILIEYCKTTERAARLLGLSRSWSRSTRTHPDQGVGQRRPRDKECPRTKRRPKLACRSVHWC